MNGDGLSRKEIAHIMRIMPRADRDEAIEASENVVDARPTFNHRRRQRELADSYRRSFERKGGPA